MGTQNWHPGKRPSLQTQVRESLSHGSELSPRRAGRRKECGGHRPEPGRVYDGRCGTQVNQQKAKNSREGEVNESLGADSWKPGEEGEAQAASKPSLLLAPS